MIRKLARRVVTPPPWLLCVATFGVASAVASAASAEPKWLRLSIVHDPSTSMTVAWHTVNPASSKVQWGLDAAKLTSTAAGTSELGPGNLGYIHEAEMTGLKPGTTYFYRVGDDTDGWSAPFSFRTSPPQSPSCGKLRFVYLGDNRPDTPVGGTNEWTSIFAEAVNEGPNFVMTGGDLVYSGKDTSQWENFLGWTGDPARYVPFMPSMGNHDDDTVVGDMATYNRIFALPRSSGTGSSGTEDYYYFTWGHAIFVSINSYLFREGSIPFGDQAAWLDEVLTNNPRRWKFVMMHHPIYTTNTLLSHPPNENDQNPALVPVLAKHHVDFVLQSHNHWYERYEPSNCLTAGTPGSSEPCPVGATAFDQGSVHITSGGAGALQILSCGSGLPERVKCTTDYHYVVFDVDGDQLEMQTWRTSRQLFGEDPGNHEMIDQLKITKTGGGGCTEPDAGAPEGGTDASAPDVSSPDATDAPSGDASPHADAAKDSSSGGKDSASPTYPDAATGDEPQPGTVGPASEAASSDGGCACTSARNPGGPSWLFALLLGAITTARLRRSSAHQQRRER
ncbi:MAG TPA: fibronectin type III domain-containing protein [Polyangiaceae bacterium]|nr:fibronectin type III domain-containing protein [Polyangiaceae bacterium]